MFRGDSSISWATSRILKPKPYVPAGTAKTNTLVAPNSGYYSGDCNSKDDACAKHVKDIEVVTAPTTNTTAIGTSGLSNLTNSDIAPGEIGGFVADGQVYFSPNSYGAPAITSGFNWLFPALLIAGWFVWKHHGLESALKAVKHLGHLA